MTVQINHRLTGKLLFEAQAPSLTQAITTANEKRMKAWRYSDDGHFLGQSYQTLNLQGAHLAGADLAGADLSFIELWDADLQGAKLWLTSFYGADLREADLEGASWYLQGRAESTTILTGAHFAGCYLGMGWSRRVLLTELLRQAAGDDPVKQRAGQQIPLIDEERYGDKIDWRAWEQSDYALKGWSLAVLASYVHKQDDILSPMIRNHTRRS